MSDGKEIKARIASITETKKVTDAMYMISSLKLNRARREVANTAPYFSALKEEIAELFRHIPETSSRYFKVPEPDSGEHMNHGILLVTSDKGLTGAYNQSVLSVCEEVLAKHPKTRLFIVGEYGRQYFCSKGIPFEQDFRYSAEMPTVWKARRICADLLECFDNGETDEINIIFTDYVSGSMGRCKRNILLPLKRSSFASATDEGEREKSEFYPDPDAVLSGVIPSYITGFIYSSLVDSFCCEQQARMNAMASASHNAEEMLRDLKTRYNRVRQAAITREMIEISSGARSLRRQRENKEND